MKNEKLIAAREARRWTQEKAAEKIKVSRVTYARWEEQGILPRLSTLEMVCAAFKMTPEQLGFKKPVNGSAHITPLYVSAIDELAGANNSTSIELFSIGLLALSLAQTYYHWTFEELQAKIEKEMQRLDIMQDSEKRENEQLSRRQIIGLLMSVPAAAFGILQLGEIPFLHNDEVLSLCSVNIPLAWQLYFTGGLDEVRQILPHYLLKLIPLAQHSSRYQRQAASLSSQAHQLGYLLALQRQDFSTAQTHAKQAFQYAEIAENPNLQVAALVRQGNLFFTLKRPLQSMQKYEEAVQHSAGASSLLVGQAYIGLAEAQSRLGMREEAERFRGMALEMFPEYPEHDLHFSYTHFNHFTRTNFEGLMYLNLQQPEKAWASFASIDKAVPLSLVPQRVELLSRQAATAVALSDLEQSCTYIELALTAALQLGSDLRYNEVCETYLHMQNKWPHEEKVKRLAELFYS